MYRKSPIFKRIERELSDLDTVKKVGVYLDISSAHVLFWSSREEIMKSSLAFMVGERRNDNHEIAYWRSCSVANLRELGMSDEAIDKLIDREFARSTMTLLRNALTSKKRKFHPGPRFVLKDKKHRRYRCTDWYDRLPPRNKLVVFRYQFAERFSDWDSDDYLSPCELLRLRKIIVNRPAGCVVITSQGADGEYVSRPLDVSVSTLQLHCAETRPVIRSLSLPKTRSSIHSSDMMDESEESDDGASN